MVAQRNKLGGVDEAEEAFDYDPYSFDLGAFMAALPVGRDEKSVKQRCKLFRKWDVNNNKTLSFSEIDTSMRLLISSLYKSSEALEKVLKTWNRCWKPIVMRAYQDAKASNAEWKSSGRDDYVEVDEFRLLLVCLRRYFELHEAFRELDTSNDGRVDLSEFTEALPYLGRYWGIHIAPADAELEFREIDANGGGFVLFDEFTRWALRHSLTMDDGEDTGLLTAPIFEGE